MHKTVHQARFQRTAQVIQKVKEFFSYYLSGLYHKLDEHHAFLMSSGLTFSIITCLLPFILILFSVLGILLEATPIKLQITNYIETLVPYEKSASWIKNVVLSTINEFRIFRTISGSLGVIGLLFAASGLFSSMRTLLNLIYRVSETRHIVIGKLRDFGMILLVVFFFLITLALIPLLDIALVLVQKIQPVHTLFKFFNPFLFESMSFLVLFLMFLLIYYMVP